MDGSVMYCISSSCSSTNPVMIWSYVNEIVLIRMCLKIAKILAEEFSFSFPFALCLTSCNYTYTYVSAQLGIITCYPWSPVRIVTNPTKERNTLAITSIKIQPISCHRLLNHDSRASPTAVLLSTPLQTIPRKITELFSAPLRAPSRVRCPSPISIYISSRDVEIITPIVSSK